MMLDTEVLFFLKFTHLNFKQFLTFEINFGGRDCFGKKIQ